MIDQAWTVVDDADNLAWNVETGEEERYGWIPQMDDFGNGETGYMRPDKAHRVAACWNACKGVPDPERFVPDAMDILQAFAWCNDQDEVAEVMERVHRFVDSMEEAQE